MIQKTPPESFTMEKTILESSELHEIMPESLTMDQKAIGETMAKSPSMATTMS